MTRLVARAIWLSVALIAWGGAVWVAVAAIAAAFGWTGFVHALGATTFASNLTETSWDRIVEAAIGVAGFAALLSIVGWVALQAGVGKADSRWPTTTQWRASDQKANGSDTHTVTPLPTSPDDYDPTDSIIEGVRLRRDERRPPNRPD